MLLRLGQLGFGGLSASSVFAPTSIANLAVWLDAADGSTITDIAGAVSQWDDKSGNFNHATQTTGASQPLTGSGALNGKNVLSFDSDFLQLTSNQEYRTLIFVADKINGVGVLGALIGSLLPNVGHYVFVAVNSPDAYYDISVDGSGGHAGEASVNGGAFVSGTNIDLGRTNAQNEGKNIWVVRMDAVNYIDYIGAFGSGGLNPLIGNVAEVIAYNRLLSDVEVNQIGSYVGSKWGISWANI